jgi:F-type H+-transporting ATPase subunit a
VAATETVVIDPIHQFQIVPLGGKITILGQDYSFTNSALFMFIIVGIACVLMLYGTRKRAVVPGRLQAAMELFYEFTADTVVSTTGKDGLRFLPLVFSLFIFITLSNYMGLIPGAFTVTSHIIVTFAFAMLVILTVVIYGMIRHGGRFFGLFVPSGVPPVLLPFISLIEIVSFLSRPVSLSMRLFANILAGHIALKVFGSFIIMLLAAGGWAVLSPLPLLMIVGLSALEFLVAGLQAFVFAILTCIYLNDALHPGH